MAEGARGAATRRKERVRVEAAAFHTAHVRGRGSAGWPQYTNLAMKPLVEPVFLTANADRRAVSFTLAE